MGFPIPQYIDWISIYDIYGNWGFFDVRILFKIQSMRSLNWSTVFYSSSLRFYLIHHIISVNQSCVLTQQNYFDHVGFGDELWMNLKETA